MSSKKRNNLGGKGSQLISPCLQGHRGARGVYPENSLQSFAYAFEQGMDGVELDIAVTRDGQVVVTHDQRLNPDITRNRDGVWLISPTPRICELNLSQLYEYDTGQIRGGTKYASEFNQQIAVDNTRIPTLDEVIDLIEGYGDSKFFLNVEVKTSPDKPHETFSPKYVVGCLLEVLMKRGFDSRTIVQSFDWRVPHYVQHFAPTVATCYLTAQQPWFDTITSVGSVPSPWLGGISPKYADLRVPEMIAAVGGKHWGPYHRDITRDDILLAKQLGLFVMVWTVNDGEDMRRLLEWGIDGIISDYPKRLRKVASGLGLRH